MIMKKVSIILWCFLMINTVSLSSWANEVKEMGQEGVESNFWTDDGIFFDNPAITRKDLSYYKMPKEYKGSLEKTLSTEEVLIEEYLPNNPAVKDILLYIEKTYKQGRSEIFYKHKNGRWYRFIDEDGDNRVDLLDNP